MEQHKISLTTAILLNINIMIGSGILIGPGQIAAIAGNASFLAWPLVALIFCPLVLCTVQLSRMFPGCGGFYSYAKEGLGKLGGFLCGWMYLIGYIFCIAVDILALRKTFIVFAGEHLLLNNQLLFTLCSLTCFICFNLLSFRTLSRILSSLTITKMLPLIIAILIFPFVVDFNLHVSLHELSLLPYSLPLAIFGFLGFEACCSVSHLIENGEKNAPKAILGGFLITALLYTLFHFSLISIMGAGNLAQFGAPAYAGFLQGFSNYFTSLLALLIPLSSLCTIFAASNGLMSANAVMMHSIAQERAFYGYKLLLPLSINERPLICLIIQAIIIFTVIALLQSINVIGGICNLFLFSSFIAVFASLFILQKANRQYNKLILTSTALITTIVLALYSWYVLADTFLLRLQYALPFLIVFSIGLILFFANKEQRNQFGNA